MKQALVVGRLDQITVSVEADTISHRDKVLAESSGITSVSDEFCQSCAVDALRELNALDKSVEKSRSEVKAPVLDIGRQIDGIAKDFRAPIAVEIARLNKLVTAYQVEVRQKAEAAERARQAELARIEAERIKAQREEEARLQAARKAEIDAQAARDAAEVAFTKQESAEAEKQRKAAEAQRFQAEAAALVAQRQQAELESQRLATQNAIAPLVFKPAGLVVKEVWKFEVTDLWLLAKDNRELVRLEANTSAINEQVRVGMRFCPGLRIYSETVTGVRS